MTKFLDCYFRVSTQEQTKGQSLDTQQEYGKKIAKKLNLKFRPRDEGARSSTIGFRPRLEEIKEDIEKGLVKHLWVFDRSRLFRDETDSVLFRRNYLEKFDVRFYEGEAGNLCNFDSLEEKLTYDIVSKLQQYENEKRSHKSKQGKRYLLRQGVSNRHYGGTVLFGYKSIDGVLSVDELESKWVLFIFNSVLEGKSTMDIKKVLDTDGKTDGVHPRRTSDKNWNIGTLESILRNRSYIGEKEFYDKELDVTFTYTIPPIVSRSTFNKVRNEMEKRRKTQDNNKKHTTIFGDYMVCECGEKIGSTVKVGKRKDGSSFNTKSYYCVTRERNWKKVKETNCSNRKSMNMDMADEYLISKIRDVVSDSVILKEKFKHDVLSKKFDKDADIKERETKLEEKCRKLIRRQEQTYENIISMETDLVQGRREKKITEGIIKNLTVELETLKNELKKTELEIEDLSEEKIWLDWLERYGDDLKTKVSTSTENQKEWLDGLIRKIVVLVEYGEDRDGNIKQLGHKFEVLFRIPVVRDKLVYHDKNDKSKGYSVKDGVSKLTTQTVNLQKGRGKKKDLKQGKEEGFNYNHRSNLFGNSGVSRNSDYFSENWQQFLCFSVTFSSFNLTHRINKRNWTEEQQRNHDLIMSLHESGISYRRITKLLNNRGINTHRGKRWGKMKVIWERNQD